MGLTDAVRRFGTSRPHILLLTEPGGLLARLEVERYARLRGWPLTDGPADADLLVVAGCRGDLAPYAERVWNQLPGPRACAVIGPQDDATPALERARRQLADVGAQRAELRTPDREVEPASLSGQEMGGHAGHDMGGMELPFGLGMADRAVDRDGLKLDVLTVTWGPALPWWPVGLTVTTVLQGDVITEARVERVGDPDAERKAWSDLADRLGLARVCAAARLDSLARLMAVAGWQRALLCAQRIRDELLTDGDRAQISRMLHPLSRRVIASRPLAAMTSGIYTSSGLDVPGRYRNWLHEATDAVDHGTPPPVDSVGAQTVLADLPTLLVGTELATARLIVASLDLELNGVGPQVVAHV